MTFISHSETKSCLLWETDILEEKSKLWSTQKVWSIICLSNFMNSRCWTCKLLCAFNMLMKKNYVSFVFYKELNVMLINIL